MKFTAAILAILLSAQPLLSQEPKAPAQSKEDKAEVDIGKQGVADVEKEGKLVKDQAILDRVNKVGQALAEIARKEKLPAHYGYDRLSPFDYSFRVIEDKDINAFSLPGGFIFINTGLLDFVQSDDELAGVLAHEIAHAAHHHMVKLSEDAGKVNRDSFLAAIAAMVLSGGGGENLVNVLGGMNLYQMARTNAYVNEAEVDADTTGYRYMRASSFNPVAMLTFMERLNAKYLLHGQADLGIARTHPPTAQRADNILSMLRTEKLPIARSQVATSERVQVRAAKEAGRSELFLDDYVLGTVATPTDPASLVAPLNAALDKELEVYEVQQAGPGRIVARGATILELSEADAAASGKSLEDLTRAVRLSLKQVVARLARSRSLASNGLARSPFGK